MFTPCRDFVAIGGSTWEKKVETDTRTADVEVVEVDALGDELEDADVGELGAAAQFDVAQFGTASRQRLQAAVGEARAAVEQHALHRRTEGRRGAAQHSRYALKKNQKEKQTQRNE